jgi:hypothetical protein
MINIKGDCKEVIPGYFKANKASQQHIHIGQASKPIQVAANKAKTTTYKVM